MEEEWKDVVGYEGLYQVSNLGRIKSLGGKRTRSKGKIMKQNLGASGYFRITLSKNGNVKAISVHRIVATAFIPNPQKLPCINHKDENKQNNTVSNLEWCTVAYNNKYGHRIEKTQREVVLKSIDGADLLVFPSVSIASRATGIPVPHIVRACKHPQRSAHNSKWRYFQ